MANILKIRKVNSLPGVLEASTLYFLVDGSNILNIYLTNSAGNTIYTTYNSTSIAAITNSILTSLYNQPNGILKLNNSAKIDVGFITKINGSTVDISEGGVNLYKTITLRIILSGGTGPTAVNTNSLSGLSFSGTVNNLAFFDFAIPFDYDGVTPLIFRFFYYLPTAAAGSNSVDFVFDYSFYDTFALTTTVTNINTSLNLTTASNVANQVGVFALVLPSPIPTTCVPGGVFRCRVTRNGAADASANTIVVSAVHVIYKSKRIGVLTNTPPF
jgi:hypothetical protein